MPIKSAAAPQASARPALDHTSIAASEAGENVAIERVERQRQRDVDQRDDAGGGVVALLDSLVIDQERQGDDAFGTDEQHDAELIDGEEQAAAGPRGPGRPARRP